MDTHHVNLIEAEGRIALQSWIQMTHLNIGMVLKDHLIPSKHNNRIRLYCQKTYSMFECRCDGEIVDQIRMIRLQEPTIDGLEWFHEYLLATEQPHTLVITGIFSK